MIKCKEDLHNTYIDKSNKELVSKYKEAADKFGIKPCSSETYLKEFSKLEITNIVGVFKVYACDHPEEYSTELTLADFEEVKDESPHKSLQNISDTKWLQLESLKRFARSMEYTWGGDGAFYNFGDDNFEDDKISLKGMQMLHNKNESRNNKIVKATFLQWNKKTKSLICQKHLVKLN